MRYDRAKRLLILFILFNLIFLTVATAGWIAVKAAGEVKTLDRNLEPVIVTGSQVAGLLNAPLSHLFIYTFTGNSLGGQIPIQVDEVATDGSYTLSGDGLLSPNDEIVLMAKDLGDRPTDTAILTGTLPISDTWYQIEVTDPLDSSKKGWAYLVGSGTLGTGVTDDYVEIVTSSQRITITTGQYELGLPTVYETIDYLTVNGNSQELLDRTKLRVALLVFSTLTTVTEQGLTDPDLVLVKDGPVRVILGRTLQENFSGLGDIALANTYLAYPAVVQTVSEVEFDLGSAVSLAGVRTSVDFSQAISGAATFYNANTLGSGVPIDGSPDGVVDSPTVSHWGQVSHTTGRMIQVVNPAPIGGSAKTYYRDNSSQESSFPTGEPGSYGESGLLFKGAINQAFTFNSSLFVLSPELTNVGATYESYFFHPLRICTGLKGASCQALFLPVIIKSS